MKPPKPSCSGIQENGRSSPARESILAAASTRCGNSSNPGGHLFLIVPDEDLYEQGIFSSRFNADHKATFTISKARSWSPVSVNVLDLARSLPNAELVSIELQDHHYDRRMLTHGMPRRRLPIGAVARAYRDFKRKTGIGFRLLDALHRQFIVVDQTQGSALARIQCIVRKRPAA